VAGATISVVEYLTEPVILCVTALSDLGVAVRLPVAICSLFGQSRIEFQQEAGWSRVATDQKAKRRFLAETLHVRR
jgi:hypothetical protein